MAGKIAAQTQDYSYKRNSSMIEQFRWINSAVTNQLGDIIASQKARAGDGNGSDDESINAKDFINEFENEEFKTKNIRVRPESSGDFRHDDKSEHASKFGGAVSVDPEEDERKFNADVSHDLSMMRKERKDFLFA